MNYIKYRCIYAHLKEVTETKKCHYNVKIKEEPGTAIDTLAYLHMMCNWENRDSSVTLKAEADVHILLTRHIRKQIIE